MKEESKRLIVISDIHGCIQEFTELLNKIQYNANSDRLIIGGDLNDRGEDSVGVIRKCRELKLEAVRGNHDEKILNWYWKGKKPIHKPEQKYYNELIEADFDYLKSLPYYIKVSDDLLIVHAGIKPNIPIEEQTKNDLSHLRFTDKDRNTISLRKIAKGQGEGAMFWTEFGSFFTNVIYGHNVSSLETIKIDRFDDGTACYGIDTGCAFGGHLTAFIWDTKEVVQVKAKRQYYKLGFE